MSHQLFGSKLTKEPSRLFYHQKAILLVPLPEISLDEGSGKSVPDLILYDQLAEETKMIADVCRSNGQHNDLRRGIYLIEDNDYGILEWFVCNYRTSQWSRHTKGDRGVPTELSLSEVLGLTRAGCCKHFAPGKLFRTFECYIKTLDTEYRPCDYEV